MITFKETELLLDLPTAEFLAKNTTIKTPPTVTAPTNKALSRSEGHSIHSPLYIWCPSLHTLHNFDCMKPASELHSTAGADAFDKVS